MTIGEMIRMHRKDKKMALEDIGRICNVPRSTVYRWENGEIKKISRLNIELKAGLRRGEVLALRKTDIHDDRIWVTKAIRFENNRPVEGDTKNESSERSVPLFATLKPFIKQIKDYAFPDAKGKVCSETAFQRAWESYLHTLSVKAGHPVSFRPHDLRHTFVTACRNKDIDIRTVMQWCGHTSERMILEIYDHPSEKREKSAIKKMDR